MLVKRIVVVPIQEDLFNVCDYIWQTVRVLQSKNLVVIFMLSNSRSIWEVVRMVTRGEKFQLVKRREEVYLVTPILLFPLRRFRWVEELNNWLVLVLMQMVLLAVGFVKGYQLRPIVWVFYAYLVKWAEKFRHGGGIVIYDVVDDLTDSASWQPKQIKLWEKNLLSLADLVVVNSQTLYDRYVRLRPDVKQVPLGFAREIFETGRAKDERLNVTSMGKPVVGFVGQLNQRLDLDLLEQLIKRNPQWQFVFVGPYVRDVNIPVKSTERLQRILTADWVTVLPQQPKAFIPGIIKQFDVAVIPYDVRYAYNRNCFPMKVMEYFYMGKPVIATGITELYQFSELVTVAHTVEEWEAAVKKMTKQPWPQVKKKRQRQIAVRNSWGEKIEVVSRYVECI